MKEFKFYSHCLILGGSGDGQEEGELKYSHILIHLVPELIPNSEAKYCYFYERYYY